MSNFHGVTSTDTVFIRGFTARHRVEDIRNFFIREAGRNSVEFCRETGDGYLLIALKFESRSIAKEVLNRFDNVEVLDERIRITWYRDMRKSFNNYNDQAGYRRGSQNQQWGTDRSYEYRGARGNGPSYHGRGGAGPYTSTPRKWYPRDGHGGGSREYDDERQSRRRFGGRSTSRSRSRSESGHSGSPRSRTRSSSNDGLVSRSKSNGSRDRTRKLRSSSDVSHRDTSSHRGKSKSDKVDAKGASSSDSSHSDNGDASPPPQSHKKDKKKKKKSQTSSKTSPPVERSPKNKKANKDDVDESSTDDAVPPTHPDGSLEPVDGDAGKPSASVSLKCAGEAVPASRKQGSLRTQSDSEPSEVFADGHNNDSLLDLGTQASTDQKTHKSSAPHWKKLKEESLTDDIFSEKDFAQHEKIRKTVSSQRQPNDDVLATDSANDPSTMENEQPMDEHRFKMPSSIPHLGNSAKKRKSTEDPKRPAEPSNGQDADECAKRMRKVPSEVIPNMKSAELSSSKTAGSSPKKQPINEDGQWRLPPDKMALVHEKKAEIEKAYKQDCETFATVTKMLISKDPGIEDRIQMSLRENLKEIGQRCIQELRDFIERLRTEIPDGSK